MPMQLKQLLRQRDLSQADLARSLAISPAAVAQIINHGVWPKRQQVAVVRRHIEMFLSDAGATDEQVAHAFDDDIITPADPMADPKEDFIMLLRKQTLSPAAKKHFFMARDPFNEHLQSAEDLFISPDIRYVREAMLQTARFGGFLAVIAESGAGKTTLMRDLEDRIQRDSMPVMLIRPYVLAMESNDQQGKTLKSGHIAEAIMAAVAPLEKLKISPQARFAQLHRALKNSHAAGYHHCLVIDEAHSLSLPTLKHLKRFLELESGFSRLLSVILIGQPELRTKLDERNGEVREVVQRCEVLEVPPLLNGALNDFLTFRLGRVDKNLTDVIDDSGIEALRERLTITSRQRHETLSLLYPLAVGNLLTAAFNLAADIGAPKVNAEVVKGV